MSTQILERVIGTADKRIVLNNSQIARTLSMGNNWNKIRIIMRICIDGTVTVPARALNLGIQAGSSQLLFDSGGPDNYIGLSNKNLMTFNAGTPNWYNVVTTPLVVDKNIGNVVTELSTRTLASSVRLISATPSTTRTVIGVTIDKTNPASLVTTGILRIVSTAPGDISLATMLGMAEGTFPVDYSESNSTNGSIDEAGDGDLDTVVVGWQTAVANLEISDLIVAKIS